MAKPDRAVRAQFTQPVRQVFFMLVVTGLVALGGYVALPRLLPVFLTNIYLNGFILGVFVLGILACYWQVLQLVSSVNWIESFVTARPGHEAHSAPRLLASLAPLLRARGTRMQIGSGSARSILDSVASRMDESRDITRYITNLLIFLGLLGTFFGLATTVPAVVETIQALNPQEGEDGMAVFARLMAGLETQLGGMGTAFASSLIGLAGSLVVGLLDLFAGHGQNRFYRELEEWLSTITRVGLASGEGEGTGPEPAAMAQVFDQMSEQMESLQNMFVQSDISRAETDSRLAELTAAVAALTERLEARAAPDASEGFARLAESQRELAAALRARSEETADAESRMRLRSIDVQLLRILEEMAAGRQDVVADLRSDITALTQAIRSLGEEAPAPPPGSADPVRTRGRR
ncbi:MAG: biopolymer transporter ExbB [Rhodobacteraceae bacterium]|nr:biopolymer transporter ExbB [Paracoccaceae bacterium]